MTWEIREYFFIWGNPQMCITWTAPWARCANLMERYIPCLHYVHPTWIYGCLLGFEVSYLRANRD